MKIREREMTHDTQVPTRQRASLLQTRQGHTLLMLLLIPFYAICFVGIRFGMAYAPPLRFAALRLLLAGSSLLLVATVTRQPLRISRQYWPWLVLLAALGGTFNYGTMFLSPGMANAGIASVLGNTQPLILVVLGAVLLGERVTRLQVASLVVGLAGVVLIALSALAQLHVRGFGGSLLALASAVAFCLAAVVMKHLGSGVPLLAMAAWQFLLGAIPLLILSAWLEGSMAVHWTPPFVAVLALLALGGTALTTSVWYWLIQHDDVGRLSLYLFLVPLFGVAFAVALIGERITLSIGAGMALTLLAVLAILQYDARRPERRQPATPSTTGLPEP